MLLFIHQIESQIQKAELEGDLKTISLLWKPRLRKSLHCIRIQSHILSLPGHCSTLQVHCLYVWKKMKRAT